jgi:hypothetical protein
MQHPDPEYQNVLNRHGGSSYKIRGSTVLNSRRRVVGDSRWLDMHVSSAGN